MNITNKLLVLAGLDPIADQAPPAPAVAPTPQAAPADGVDNPMGQEEVDPRKGKFWIVLPPSTSEATEDDVLSLVSSTELVQMIRGGQADQDSDIQVFAGNEEDDARKAASEKLANRGGTPQPNGIDDGMSARNKADTLVQNPAPTAPGPTESATIGEDIGANKPWTDEEKSEIFARADKVKLDRLRAEEKKKKESGKEDVDEAIIPANKVKVDVLDLINKDHSDSAQNDDLKFQDMGKVKVPSQVTSAVSASIKRAKEDLKRAQDRATLDNRTRVTAPQQPADVDMYIDLLNAYEKINALLKDGTEESLKQLQIFLPSIKNWMSKEFPVELIKFVAHGGKPLSVKDHFAAIKAHKTKGM